MRGELARRGNGLSWGNQRRRYVVVKAKKPQPSPPSVRLFC